MLLADVNDKQKSDFGDIARACSVFSLCGSIFIILTFLCCESFRKPITRLVFFASFGNMMSNVATLIARSYVNTPNTVACQTQGFMVQMFMPADALWSLAMAFNVYLTFYRKYDAQMLKKMELPYFAVCYGLPFIVALALCFVSSPERGRMYGDALIWCWISADWMIFRLLIFYIPVWFTIIATFFIYIRTGRQIYFKYQALKSLHSTVQSQPNPNEITASKTTEVSFESEAISSCAPDPTSLDFRNSGNTAGIAGTPGAAYSVSITSNARARNSHRHHHHDHGYTSDGGDRGHSAEFGRPSTSTMDAGDMVPLTPVRATSSLTPPPTTAPAALPQPPPSAAFTRPIPRDSLKHRPSMPTKRGSKHTRGIGRPQTLTKKPAAVSEANSAAWSYARCAMLFFTALLITWIPSTANRLYNVVHSKEISIGLQYTACFVLPLQGFWNSLIYAFTTRRSCKRLLGRFKAYLVQILRPAGKKTSESLLVPDNGKYVDHKVETPIADAGRKSDAETV